ncbi:hypothetical protein [Carnimonas bestiolae]|uniref:hypothetical protein n=1 Tax=Carnimonas bestiolae TaxID=3402172 RepID=UPI003EDCA9B5
MKKTLTTLFSVAATTFSLAIAAPVTAATNDGPLPESGVKSPYSPLAVPTKLAPLSDSLETLLNHGYRVVTNDRYPQGMMMVIEKRASSGHSTALCVVNPPQAGTDQNVPTSRCWALN